MIGGGETVMFWSDLSAVNLIEGSFTTATSTTNPIIASSAVGKYLPAAKIGGGNFIYVWSGGFGGPSSAGQGQDAACVTSRDGQNYLGIEAITGLGSGGVTSGNSPGLTVQQAYAIDSKVDDGNPQYGNVRALFLNFAIGWDTPLWVAGGGAVGASAYSSPGKYAPTTAATPGSSTTCYDNSTAASGTPGVAGTTQHYSLEISGGANVNCALSFKMQAGD